MQRKIVLVSQLHFSRSNTVVGTTVVVEIFVLYIIKDQMYVHFAFRRKKEPESHCRIGITEIPTAICPSPRVHMSFLALDGKYRD